MSEGRVREIIEEYRDRKNVVGEYLALKELAVALASSERATDARDAEIARLREAIRAIDDFVTRRLSEPRHNETESLIHVATIAEDALAFSAPAEYVDKGTAVPPQEEIEAIARKVIEDGARDPLRALLKEAVTVVDKARRELVDDTERFGAGQQNTVAMLDAFLRRAREAVGKEVKK